MSVSFWFCPISTELDVVDTKLVFQPVIWALMNHSKNDAMFYKQHTDPWLEITKRH